jgi:hypothetical protein
MRTLLAVSDPFHHETLLALKDAQPLMIEMKGLVPPDFFFVVVVSWGFHKALAYAIFCAVSGMDGCEPETEDAFLVQRKSQQTAVGAVKALIRERRGPVVLVLDDITDLARTKLAPYFAEEKPTLQDAAGSHRCARRRPPCQGPQPVASRCRRVAVPLAAARGQRLPCRPRVGAASRYDAGLRRHHARASVRDAVRRRALLPLPAGAGPAAGEAGAAPGPLHARRARTLLPG